MENFFTRFQCGGLWNCSSVKFGNFFNWRIVRFGFSFALLCAAFKSKGHFLPGLNLIPLDSPHRIQFDQHLTVMFDLIDDFRQFRFTTDRIEVRSSCSSRRKITSRRQGGGQRVSCSLAVGKNSHVCDNPGRFLLTSSIFDNKTSRSLERVKVFIFGFDDDSTLRVPFFLRESSGGWDWDTGNGKGKAGIFAPFPEINSVWAALAAA